MRGEALPEGVEVDLMIYLTSPASGMNIALALRGYRSVPDFEAARHPASDLLGVDDWRPMTRDEITAFKAERGTDDA